MDQPLVELTKSLIEFLEKDGQPTGKISRHLLVDHAPRSSRRLDQDDVGTQLLAQHHFTDQLATKKVPKQLARVRRQLAEKLLQFSRAIRHLRFSLQMEGPFPGALQCADVLPLP